MSRIPAFPGNVVAIILVKRNGRSLIVLSSVNGQTFCVSSRNEFRGTWNRSCPSRVPRFRPFSVSVWTVPCGGNPPRAGAGTTWGLLLLGGRQRWHRSMIWHCVKKSSGSLSFLKGRAIPVYRIIHVRPARAGINRSHKSAHTVIVNLREWISRKWLRLSPNSDLVSRERTQGVYYAWRS